MDTRAAAKISNLGHVFGPNKDVVRLEIAVHDALMMRMRKSLCDLLADNHSIPVLGEIGNEISKRPAYAILSDHVVPIFIDDVAIVEFENIRMVHSFEVGNLSYDEVELLHCLRFKLLDGDQTIMDGLRLKDFSIRSFAYRLDDLILPRELFL